MPRPWIVVLLFLFIVSTSQLEWAQLLGNEIEPISKGSSEKEDWKSRAKEAVKEKIILSQEKNIQELNELVQNLQEQLLQCKSAKFVVNDTVAIELAEQRNQLDQESVSSD
ncbi:unnamed protein product [Linum tenue]|uniref:Uncharacterized protein n=2 Tax=Linum TaxID=4005 RepID=A0AAV0I1F7_9ROSI|nr:unnamed protein product [Linum tenue]CAI0391379.1 unnamed protein product [Linum tenue]